jgi:hypothetical protein
MNLQALLEEATADLDGVSSSPAGDGVEYRVGEQLIAVTGADAAEFRLDPAVAGAARRTPDTAASERGPEWVRFAPSTLDPHAADRAVAWLGSAARRAAPPTR